MKSCDGSKDLQKQMLASTQKLYDLSGSGSLEKSMKDIMAFSDQ